MTRDPRVDDYIGRQAEFARPILAHLRELVHSACPGTEEAIKWGMPAFLIGGKQYAHMAGFKSHASFGFWNGSAVVEGKASENGMGQFGRLTTLEDLPAADVLTELARKAAKLRNEGVQRPRATREAKPEPATPPELVAALEANPASRAQFEAFSPSAQREYSEWISEAKRPETRAKRLAQAVAWIAEGKKRNWKYEG